MKRIFLTLAVVGALAGCQSSEERAEEHYKSALTLVDQGDVDRALVELRNVFKLNGQHHDARALYARTVRARGDLKEAYGQYLRLVEQYPGDPEATLALAELSLQGGQGEEAVRYAKALRALYPDFKAAPPEAQAVTLAINYAEASGKNDKEAMTRIAAEAQPLFQTHPELVFARQIVISGEVNAQDWTAARTHIEEGIALLSKEGTTLSPESRSALRKFYDMELGVLSQLDDKPALEATLKKMIGIFPEDAAIGPTLVRWYVGAGRIDDAEAWLRGNIKPESQDPAPRMTLVRFLSELRGPDAALAEMDAILAADPRPADVAANLSTIKGLRAQFMYRMRDKAAALEDMRTIVAEAEKGGEDAAQLDRLRLGLAQMEDGQGNRVGARALVEKVLEHDATNVAALKLKGGWLIDDDKTDDALVVLRSALGQAPRDAEAMTLMARAHERAGNRDLMAEMLSLAVEASNRAPEESLRYSAYLVSERKLRAAEDVLIEALRLAPTNLQLLAQLGQVHVAMEDWPRAEQDIARIRELAPAEQSGLADELQARVLSGQHRTDDLTGFLESRVTGGDRFSAEAAVIRANVVAGRVDEALTRSQALLDEMPQDPGARFVHASVLNISGKADEARAELRSLVADQPKMIAAWTTLLALDMRAGDLEAAGKTLDAAQAANPGNAPLDFARAGLQERAGDVEGAIATYEKLYALDSNQIIIANNLASLLSTARSDPESLDRAYTLARRLRGLGVPAFQDTYGWIAFLRGDLQEALSALEPAAKGLPDLALAQYHLGRVYAALNRKDEAEAQYEKARQLIGKSADQTLLDQVNAAAAELESAAAPAAGAAGQTPPAQTPPATPGQ